jgi:hypothetical protein
MDEPKRFGLDLTAALQSRGWSDEHIVKMDPARAFDEFCEWHGLIGWGSTLRRIYQDAHKEPSK